LRLLLDTHALIWALSTPAKLPRFVAGAIDDPENFVFASAASAWEMSIKQALGRLDFPLHRLADTLAKTGIVDLAVTLRHAVAVSRLPAHHRDPFDRLLIAQAQLEDLTLVSRDPLIRQYQVPVLWST
jgi:PIN domain nuclease of toxin-antitoxin system